MIPDHAVVRDSDGDLWTCRDGRWYCNTKRDIHGCTQDVLADECGPLDVFVWRGTLHHTPHQQQKEVAEQ